MVPKIGNVEEIDGGFRAHGQYRDEDRVNKNIRGPRWPNAAEAQKDLEALRTAAAMLLQGGLSYRGGAHSNKLLALGVKLLAVNYD